MVKQISLDKSHFLSYKTSWGEFWIIDQQKLYNNHKYQYFNPFQPKPSKIRLKNVEK